MDLDGVIGWLDLKDDFIALDPADDAIKGVDGLPQDTNGWTRLPLSRHTGVLALEIPRADGKTGVLEVDTGNAEDNMGWSGWEEFRNLIPYDKRFFWNYLGIFHWMV